MLYSCYGLLTSPLYLVILRRPLIPT